MEEYHEKRKDSRRFEELHENQPMSIKVLNKISLYPQQAS
jgi:hypothetical protein